MANYTIGDMIYETRTKRGYSQEEVSYGICSTSSLSRIENGQQVPSKRMFDALMQRLGASESIYSAFISKEDMELYRLTQQLIWKLERLDFQNMNALLEEIEKRIDGQNTLDQQYVLFAKANILLEEKGDSAEAERLLLDAIHITIPDFDVGKGVKRRLLTFNEITIINSLALLKYNSGEEITGLKLLFELKEYMEERGVDEEEKARKYPMIIYNITTRIGSKGMHQEVYKLCGQAISFCVACNKLIQVPYLLTNKAFAAAELNKLDEAKMLFQQAVTLYTICGKEQHARELEITILAKYNMKLY